jgi:hypothetical protein
MGFERPNRPSPRERTFAELFPWRNMRRALMLVALIIAIVVIKRSMSPLLGRASQLWGLGSAPPPARAVDRPGARGAPPGFGAHLGPTLAPRPMTPSPQPAGAP